MSARTVQVVLPFRNAAASIQAAVESITAQTFEGWDLLLVDNASTDGGATIAAAYARCDPRIRVLEEPTVGLANALDTGLRHTTAPLIARMDADDIAHPERLEKQVAFMNAYPKVGVLGTRTRFESTIAKNSGMRAFVHWQNAILTPHDHYLRRFVDAAVAHPTVMFRRELVDRFGGYDTGPVPEDHELWLRWMHHGVRFAKLPDELLTWNDHPQRLSRTHANYGKAAFFTTKAIWLAKWYLRKYANERPVIIAGTSMMCRVRARLLEAQGMRVDGFTDVRPRKVPGYTWYAHDRLPPAGEALIVSFISQRGTGDRIAAFLAGRGLVEGEDFILAA